MQENTISVVKAEAISLYQEKWLVKISVTW